MTVEVKAQPSSLNASRALGNGFLLHPVCFKRNKESQVGMRYNRCSEFLMATITDVAGRA